MSRNYSELSQVHVCWNVDNNLLGAKCEVLTAVTVKIMDLDVWHQVLWYQDFGWTNFIFRTYKVVQKWIYKAHNVTLACLWLDLLQSNWLFSNDKTLLRVITLHCMCGDSNLTKTVVSASGPGSKLVFVCKKCLQQKFVTSSKFMQTWLTDRMRQNGVHKLHPDQQVWTIVPEMADPQQQVHQTRRRV